MGPDLDPANTVRAVWHDVTVSDGEFICRRARKDDRQPILELCRTSLGWSAEDPDEAFFTWKHDDNAFGESPAWVAESPDGSLIGFRTFLRWRFRDASGQVLSAVRAVDTATDPEWRGKGVFSALTLGALRDLHSEVDFIFNTPNDKSRPGYLKMGWSLVGKVPVAARFGSVGVLRRLGDSRTAAKIWSEPVTIGEPASDLFSDHDAVEALLATARRPSGLTTDRSAAFLDWRYRFAPLHYRALAVGNSLGDGLIVFRVRRRGDAREVAVCDVLAPVTARLRRAFRHIAQGAGADYLLASASSVGLSAGFVRVVGLGPVLAWKPVRRPEIPTFADLGLVLGDIELF